MLVGFVKLKITAGFLGRPAEDQGKVIDEASLAQFLQRLFVILYIHHSQQ